MKKLLFIFLFSAAFTASYSQINALKIDYEEGLKLAKEQGKLVLVNCTSETGCPPCIHVEKNYIPSKKVGDFINKHVIFLNYPTGHKENERLEEMFNVGSHPTFILVDANGKLLSRRSGADFNEDKFIKDIAFLLNKENYIDNMKAKFDSGKLSAKEYYAYTEETDLRDEKSRALCQLYLEYAKANKMKEFVTTYYKFDPMIYFNIVDSKLYEYTLNNKDFIIGCGISKETYDQAVSMPIDNCIEKMLCNCNYNPKELEKVIQYSKKYGGRGANVRDIQIEAIKRSKAEGLKGVIAVFDKHIGKLSENDIYLLNLLVIRNYKHTAMTTPYMKEYIAKCIEKSPARGKRTYNFAI